MNDTVAPYARVMRGDRLRFIAISAVGIATLLAATAATLVFGTVQAMYRNDALRYVDFVVPELGRRWDAEFLLSAGGAPLLSTMTREQLDAALARARTRLGALVAYRGAEGTVDAGLGCSDERPITGSFATRVRFEHGMATIEVDVVLAGSRWVIRRLEIVPDEAAGA